MKSKEVLKLLNISRATLCRYVKKGFIIANKLDNGYYDYNINSVYQFINKNIPILEKFNIIYARVSTYKQKNDLANQVTELINYCNTNFITYNRVYKEIASGIDFNRNEFSKLLNDVLNYNVANIIITYKDRLSRLSFMTLKNIFTHFGTNIIIINNNGITYDNNNDIYEELLNIIHLFSTKSYSLRRKKK